MLIKFGVEPSCLTQLRVELSNFIVMVDDLLELPLVFLLVFVLSVERHGNPCHVSSLLLNQFTLNMLIVT